MWNWFKKNKQEMIAPSVRVPEPQPKKPVIEFLQGKHQGRDFWMYIEIDGEKHQEFLDIAGDYRTKMDQLPHDRSISLPNYGKIIAADLGNYPPPETQQYMAKEHRFIEPGARSKPDMDIYTLKKLHRLASGEYDHPVMNNHLQNQQDTVIPASTGMTEERRIHVLKTLIQHDYYGAVEMRKNQKK